MLLNIIVVNMQYEELSKMQYGVSIKTIVFKKCGDGSC